MKEHEQTEMDNITTEMAECVCDMICGKLNDMNADEAEEVCADCGLGKHICNVINEYNRINAFDNSQTDTIMKKYSGITLCSECEYRAEDVNGYFWCRCAKGLSGHSLGEKDGCSIGKRK